MIKLHRRGSSKLLSGDGHIGYRVNIGMCFTPDNDFGVHVLRVPPSCLLTNVKDCMLNPSKEGPLKCPDLCQGLNAAITLLPD